MFRGDFEFAEPELPESAFVDEPPGRIEFRDVAERTPGAAAGRFAAAAFEHFGLDCGEFGGGIRRREFKHGARDDHIRRNRTAPIVPLDLGGFRVVGSSIEVKSGDFPDEAADLHAGSAGVHAQRSAEGAGNARERRESAEPRFRSAAREVGQAHARARADTRVIFLKSGKSLAGEAHAEHRAGGVHSDEVGAAAEDEEGNPLFRGECEQRGKLFLVGDFREERQF